MTITIPIIPDLGEARYIAFGDFITLDEELSYGQVLHISHRPGDTSEWDSIWEAGSTDASASVDAGMANTLYGLKCTLDASGSAVTARKTISSLVQGHEHFRLRFWFDPSNASWPTTGNIAFLASYCDSYAGGTGYLWAYFRNTGSAYQMQFAVKDDNDATQSFAFADVSLQPMCIEVAYHRASVDGASDGYLEVFVDNDLLSSITGIDNWNIFADPGDLRLGLNWYATAYPTGYLSYDEVIIRDDNEAIGMGEVFRSGFETGDFSEWDSTGGSDLSVTSAAALNWSENGVSALVDDTSDSWLDKNLDWITNSLSLRFWIDPNTITSAVSNRDVWPLRIRKGFGSYNFLQIALNYSSGQHGIGVLARNDDDTSEISSLYTITNAPHCIELVAHNSSDAVSADGQVSLYIDGSFKETITGIDWYDGWNALLDLHFGEIWADSDMSGTFYLDELVLRDDGQRIGFGRLTHIDHETGDFSEYDGEQDTENDLAITTNAALFGTYGMEATIDNSTAMWAWKDFAYSGIVTNQFRMRGYIDVNSLSISGSEGVRFGLVWTNNDWQNIGTLVYFFLRWNVDEYGVVVYARDDYGGYNTSTLSTLPNDKVCLEFLMLRETAPGENDGRVEWWIDGVIQSPITGLTNYNIFQTGDGHRWGPDQIYLYTSMSGTMYFDDVETNDSGLEIGPLAEEGPTWVSPANYSIIDANPVLVFTSPTFTGNAHFHLQLDKVNTFDGGDLRDYKTNHSTTNWEYWDGDSWEPFPSTGMADTYSGNNVRLTISTDLTAGTWYRRVRLG